MAKKPDQKTDKKPDQKTDHLGGGFETENTGGGFLADEDEFDRRKLWRLGSWGVASVGAVVLAVLANQSSIGWRRDQVAAADLTRQAQQLQSVARDSQSEARRLALAVETLNSDRDRLYSRVTLLEQGLESVTGTIAKQAAVPVSLQPVPAWPAGETAAVPASPPPVVAAVATTAAAAPTKPPKAAVETVEATVAPAPATLSSVGPKPQDPPVASPATPLMAERSIMAPPDPAAGKLIEPEPPKTVTSAPIPEIVAAVGVNAEAEAIAPKLLRTEFGVDVGGANSVSGLRALWRGLLKSKSNAPLSELRPIIVVKEGTGGLGLQLRLVAGPLRDAAAAAKICAALIETRRTCETTVFDGQRLSLQADEPPTAAKPAPRKRSSAKPTPEAVEETAKKPEPRSLSTLFKRD